MHSEQNIGRAKQILADFPENATTREWILWLAKAVYFLLLRYIHKD